MVLMLSEHTESQFAVCGAVQPQAGQSAQSADPCPPQHYKHQVVNENNRK